MSTSPPRASDSPDINNATNRDGAPVTVLAWRRANLVMVVIGTSFPASSVEALARLVDGRAAGMAG